MTDPNDPFARMPILKHGSATEDEIWLAVGRALSHWEYAETAIALAFFGLMQTDTLDHGPILAPAARAYAAVITFNGRLDMLQAASDAYFKEHEKQLGLDTYAQRVLDKLIKIARKLGTRRNEIAHAMVQSGYSGGAGDGLFLGPAYTSNKVDYFTWEPAYLFTAEQISTYAARFIELHRCFEYFFYDVLRPSPETPRQQRPDWIPEP